MTAIGIMGGTFNPIHIGHIKIAEAAYAQYKLDEIWFMPNHIPAYKSEDNIVSGEERLAMIELAVKDVPYFKTSDFELQREGKTYTAETLELLNKKYPENTFYFIMGADSLFYFDQWKNAEKIPEYATLLVAPRDGKSVSELERRINELNNLYQKNCFHLFKCKEIPCSSSDIRKIFSQNILDNQKSCQNTFNNERKEISWVKQYLPVLVYEYIINKHLYKTDGELR